MVRGVVESELGPLIRTTTAATTTTRATKTLNVVRSPSRFSGRSGRNTNEAFAVRWNNIISPTEPRLALKTEVMRRVKATTEMPNSQNGVSSRRSHQQSPRPPSRIPDKTEPMAEGEKLGSPAPWTKRKGPAGGQAISRKGFGSSEPTSPTRSWFSTYCGLGLLQYGQAGSRDLKSAPT